MKKLFSLLGLITLAFTSASTLASPWYIDKHQPTIAWHSCYPDLAYIGDFLCGDLAVPLDYSEYKGGEPTEDNFLTLKLVRIPAKNQDEKLGSLFFNYGGPSAPGIVNTIHLSPIMFTQEVRNRYDLIGFDPRGIGESTPLKCFAHFDEFLPFLTAPAFPLNPDEELTKIDSSDAIAKACELRGGDLYTNMSTADVARDLDWLRRAVGDRELNFYGMSYGSYVGATYANMFPHKVGKIIVDGVLNPVAWATGRGLQRKYMPVSARLKSDKGTMDSLGEFYRLCRLAGGNCAISHGPEQAFATSVELVSKYEIVVYDQFGNSFVLTEQNIYQETVGALYSPASWQRYAELLAQLENLYFIIEAANTGTPENYESQLTAVNEAYLAYQTEMYGDQLNGYEEEPFETGIEWFSNVMCSDSNNPSSPYDWITSSYIAEYRYDFAGAYWNWASLPCAHIKPTESRYKGPFNRRTKNPILIIGTYFDPATAFEGSLAMKRLLPNSHLLAVEGWGHVSFLSSQCADEASADFLLSGTTPEPGAICSPSFAPFELEVESAIADIQAPVRTRHFGPSKRKFFKHLDAEKRFARKRLNRKLKHRH